VGIEFADQNSQVSPFEGVTNRLPIQLLKIVRKQRTLCTLCKSPHIYWVLCQGEIKRLTICLPEALPEFTGRIAVRIQPGGWDG
jgi:hypothetical protein